MWHVLLGHTEHGRLAEAEADFAACYTLAPPPALWVCQPLFGPLGIEAMCGMSGRAAECACSRYQSWLRHHSADGRLEPYEKSLVESFSARLLIERQQAELGGENPMP